MASKCQALLDISIPMVVDDLDDKVGRMYSGMPDRFYIVDKSGKIAFKSPRGPFGFRVAEMEQALATLLLEQLPAPKPKKNAAGEGQSKSK